MAYTPAKRLISFFLLVNGIYSIVHIYSIVRNGWNPMELDTEEAKL